MSDALAAVGLLMVLEGALYALFPGFMKRMASQVLETPGDTLRTLGVVSAALGVGCVWIARG